MANQKIYDVIIIGAGPAGVQAGLYLVRANKSVLVLHTPDIGSLGNAKTIENFYGVGAIDGKSLMGIGVDQLKKLGANVKECVVSSVAIDYETNDVVVSSAENRFMSKSLILAMGKAIEKKGEFELPEASGVSFCALCDGYFYRGKKVAVLGDKEYAFAEFEHLLNVTDDITLLTNAKSSKKLPKTITKINNNKILGIKKGKKRLIEVCFADGSHEEFDGLFVAEGDFDNNAISKILGIVIDSQGHVKVDDNMMTNVEGVFACGDMIGAPYQIAKAVADGMKAGLSVINFLNKQKINK